MDTVRTPSAADRVYESVRQGILSGRYADNELLAEGAIAAETGVSRTPVREALLRLEAQGMIRLLPKRGALVLPVTAQEWRDVLATRLLVETHCTGSVIESGRGPAVARALEVPLADLRAAADGHDLPAYVSADRTFHATIVAANNNMILIRLYGSLRDRQMRMGAANLSAPDGEPDIARMRSTIADHEAIAAAIRQEDLALAERLTREHLRHADRALGGAGVS
jgi:DNA-binding GntR family transcriptional regulator